MTTRKWITLPKLPGVPKLKLTSTGPRRQVIHAEPALPELGPYSSLPEKIFARALMQRGIPFMTQVSVAGGRQAIGGFVLDFVLYTLGLVVRIQGDYWHTREGAIAKDAAQALLLKSRGQRLVDVWEHDILTRLDWVLREQIGVAV